MNETKRNVSIAQRIVRTLLPLGVLFIGIVIAGGLVGSRPQPEKVARQEVGELVEVIEVQPRTHAVTVTANGTVMPARQITLNPEVSGRVAWISDKLLPGGRIQAGEQIARIDARDYQLAVNQQFAQVDRAQTELELERSRKQIAEREWEMLGGSKPTEGESLALRDPQLRTAEAALKSARSGLDRAKLAVAKTVLRAPFNVMVQSKLVDQGQLVGPQSPLATLVGTDVFWVQVSVPVERLGWIRIPGVQGATEGSHVDVIQNLGHDTIVRTGKVLRLLGDLDPVGRMARVLVEIEDPLGLRAGGAGGQPRTQDAASSEGADDSAASNLPLLLGSYVTVEIHGQEVDDLIELPRVAMHDGDQVYVMSRENTLAIKKIDVLWRRLDTVVVADGLAAGDKVIVSPIGVPVEGMKLRTRDMIQSAEAGAEGGGEGGAEAGAKGDGEGGAKAGAEGAAAAPGAAPAKPAEAQANEQAKGQAGDQADDQAGDTGEQKDEQASQGGGSNARTLAQPRR